MGILRTLFVLFLIWTMLGVAGLLIAPEKVWRALADRVESHSKECSPHHAEIRPVWFFAAAVLAAIMACSVYGPVFLAGSLAHRIWPDKD